MKKRVPLYTTLTTAGVLGVMAACTAQDRALGPSAVSPSISALASHAGDRGAWQFTPLASSAVCTVGGDAVKPLVLPIGFDQIAVASEPSYADVPDMNVQNETGPQAGRYLYRVHEVGSNGSLSVTDLETGVTKTIAQRTDWESLDPTAWTPWGTLLFAEETGSARFRDPDYPAAVGGLVYEVFFAKGDPTVVEKVVARPAIGAKSHEGMRFDSKGNLYSISERTPGYLFKFVPDRKGDLSEGQTYVLRITSADGDRTGDAEWVSLDRAAVQVDASAAADAVHATGYGRPEDVEMAFGHSGSVKDDRFYVAITSEHRVLAVDLGKDGESGQATAHVSQYLRAGVNAPADFEMPDNLALDRAGNLYITEDPGGSFASGKRKGDDIWVAAPGVGGNAAASSVVRFASLTDCEAEPTGIYFDRNADRLFVNVQHRGGDMLDKTMAMFPSSRDR
jgi:sugar lactone lactonase YvrE